MSHLHAVGYRGLAQATPRPRPRPYVPQPPHILPLLTTRQSEVVALIRRGYHSCKTIASGMGWTVDTTRFMLQALYKRLQSKGYAVDGMVSLVEWVYAPEVLRERFIKNVISRGEPSE